MLDVEQLRTLYERKRRAFSAKPSHARATGSSTARLVSGMTAITTSGHHALAMDLGEAEGGTGLSPTPGQVMRSGLVGCLALGYRLWAARLGVAIGEVSVDMTCELDARGQLGMGGVAPGWQRVTWEVRVVSDAAEEDVLRVLDTADRASPMLACLDRDIARQRSVVISRRSA